MTKPSTYVYIYEQKCVHKRSQRRLQLNLATRDIFRIFTMLEHVSTIVKIKVMFKTDAVIDLWVGINGGYITVDEYYEMLNLLN